MSRPKFIPREVLSQIFVTLPVKTLVRCRSVCKSWCDTIDDPHFAYNHLEHCKINSSENEILLAHEGLGRSADTGCSLTLRQADTLEEIACIFKRSDTYAYRILGSCNGLLLVRRRTPPHYERELRLWNPSIRKSLILPTCPFPTPFLDKTEYVFGFIPRDFKVIAITYERQDIDPTKMYVAVYTLSDQRWTVRNNVLNICRGYFKRMCKRRPSVFCQGAAHWLGIDPNGDNSSWKELTHLVSLDFGMEKFTFVELPFASDERGSKRFLFLFRESLAVLSISSETFSIWVLEKEAWTTLFLETSNWYISEAFMHWSYSKTKLFYSDCDGGCFISRNNYFDIASGEKLSEATSKSFELETYTESLVLCKGYGAKDLESFP